MFEEKIGAGIVELEQQVPEFRTMVNLRNLDMLSSVWCLLGQITSHERWGAFRDPDGYYIAVERLEISDPIALGFMLDEDLTQSIDERIDVYDLLTAEWRRALTAV